MRVFFFCVYVSVLCMVTYSVVYIVTSRHASCSVCVCVFCVYVSVLCMVTCSVVYIVTSRHATCNVCVCVLVNDEKSFR